MFGEDSEQIGKLPYTGGANLEQMTITPKTWDCIPLLTNLQNVGKGSKDVDPDMN